MANPTADATIKLPAMAGGTYHVPVLAAASTTAIAATPEQLNYLDIATLGTSEASKAVTTAGNGATTLSSLVATTADINAGTVDAVIGGTAPAAGTFTTLTANTGLTLGTATANGPISGVNAADGASDNDHGVSAKDITITAPNGGNGNGTGDTNGGTGGNIILTPGSGGSKGNNGTDGIRGGISLNFATKENLIFKSKTQLITLDTNTTDITEVDNFFPAFSLVLSLTVKVETTINTATENNSIKKVGTDVIDTAFSGGSLLDNGVLSAKNTVRCFNVNGDSANGSAKKLKITSDGNNAGGKIQVTALFLDLTNFVPDNFA